MSRRQLAWRRALLLACVIAMDALWLSAWANLLVGSQHPPFHHVPGPALLALLFITLSVARWLAASRLSLRLQQVLCAALAIVTGIALSGLFLYPEYPFGELDWLLVWARDLGHEAGGGSLALAGVALYAWWRGIALAQSRLASDVVGLYFRVGIIAWLSFFSLSAFMGANPPAIWLLAYFALGLVAVGLARVDEAQRGRGAVRSPFAGSWLLILGGSAFGVVGLGMMAAFAASALSLPVYYGLLVPLAGVLDRIFLGLLRLLGWILGPFLEAGIAWLQGLLAPYAEAARKMPTPALEPTPEFAQQGPLNTLPLQIAFWVVLALGLLAAAALVAGALQRRRAQEEAPAALEATWEAAQAERGAGLGALLGRWRNRVAGTLGALRPGSYSLASVREIYAGLQKLAAWRGVARAEAQTPYEYERQLDGAWPEAEREVEAITGAYVRAHYGQRRIRPEEMEALRAAWQRLREAIEGASPQT